MSFCTHERVVAHGGERSRAEDRVGHLSVVGRYHRLPARLEDDYNVEKKACDADNMSYMSLEEGLGIGRIQGISC